LLGNKDRKKNKTIQDHHNSAIVISQITNLEKGLKFQPIQREAVVSRRQSAGSTNKSTQSIGTSPMMFDQISPEQDNFNAYFNNEKLKMINQNKQ